MHNTDKRIAAVQWGEMISRDIYAGPVVLYWLSLLMLRYESQTGYNSHTELENYYNIIKTIRGNTIEERLQKCKMQRDEYYCSNNHCIAST